ncbi:MAG: hypothetical protein WAX04_14725 [Oscillospiraceae bacterium]
MSKKVIIIKVVAFLLLLVLLFMSLTQWLKRKEFFPPWGMTTKIVGFANEPKNSMDVIFFGSSHAFCTFDPQVVEEKTGLSAYTYGTQQQPLWITYHYMKEALKYQSPKVMVLEILGAKDNQEYANETANRSAFEPLKNSKNRNEMLEVSVSKKDRFTYYFPLVKYHSRWDKVTPEDFGTKYYKGRDPLRGYVRLEKTSKGSPTDLTNVKERTLLYKKTEEYLNKIIELAKSESIELMLVGAPCNADTELKKVYNTVEQIANENNIPFIDYNVMYDKVGFDADKHFFDGVHVNYDGAKIITAHFTDYMTGLGFFKE